MTTYKCSKCKQVLTVDCFHKNPGGCGHYTICKICRSMDHRRIMNDLLSNAKKRAVKKNLAYELTREFIYSLNEQQGGLCAYTKTPLNWKISKVGKLKQRICPPDRVSIDRINPVDGYVIGNVHLVTDFVNRIKTWYPENDFIAFCQQVVDCFKK
jgi:hypothetical protein